VTWAQAKQAILAHWETAWAAATWSIPNPQTGTPQTAVPYAFNNESFGEPEDGSAYAKVYVNDDISAQATIGPPGHRVHEDLGAVLVHLFSPVDTGDEGLDQLKEVAMAIYQSVSIGSTDADTVDFFGAVRKSQPKRDGRRWRVVLDFPFVYRHTK